MPVTPKTFSTTGAGISFGTGVMAWAPSPASA